MVGPNNLLLFTIIFIFKDASSNIVSPHSWGFLFVGWWVYLWMGYGRTLEEKIIIGVFLIGMLAWWAYNEYKIDNHDD